jgi:hypothetical protein
LRWPDPSIDSAPQARIDGFSLTWSDDPVGKGSERAIWTVVADQFWVPNTHGLFDFDEIVIGKKEGLLDDKIQQLSKTHAVDLADDVFLIAHAEILRGVAQLGNGADASRCQPV